MGKTKDAAFGELRNVMDMCVISALIAKEQLLAKAGCELPTLWSQQSKLNVVRFWSVLLVFWALLGSIWGDLQ